MTPRPHAAVFALAGALIACGGPAPVADPAPDRAAANIRAFARLYGVLRWFHPSDEAAAIDWDRYAVLGVSRVRGAADRHALAVAFEGLVAPIAPTVQILEPGELPALAPPIGAGETAIWWQHAGPGLTGNEPPYVSKRRGRPAPAVVTDGYGFGMISQGIPAAPYRGKRIRLRARVRGTGGGAGQAWLRIDRAGGQTGFFDNMEDRPVTGAAWTVIEIVGEVAADAEAIVFGGLKVAAGGGAASFDDFELAVDSGGGWQAVAIDNPGFEHDLAGWTGTTELTPGVIGATAVGGGASGARAVRFEAVAGEARVDEPFEERPEMNEVTVVDLGDGLVARVPLVLASRAGATLPAGNPALLAAPLAAIAPSARDSDTRLADVVVAWNVFAHFYPYLDVIGEDWNRVLDLAIRDSLGDRTAIDHVETMEHLLARAQDGHASFQRARTRLWGPPLRFDWIEGSIVVTSSGDPSVMRGDIVTSVAGQPTNDRLALLEGRVSGSVQWRRRVAAERLAAGPVREPVTLGLLRNGTEIEVEVARGDVPPPPMFERPEVAEIEPGIWYIDLDRAAWPLVGVTLEQLAAARGVVLDLRGYPAGNHAILAHVVTRTSDPPWLHIAHMIRPFQRDVVGWDHMSWNLAQQAPHLDNVVFITGPMAISYAESVLGYAERDRLPIVGSATAGANGNVKRVRLPGGGAISFTGMRVTRHDGGQRHLIGVRPTILAAPTIAGIAAGRDELLERALSVVRGQ